MGIQKELTLEVSIQTDHPTQGFNADFVIMRGNTMSEAEKELSSRQSERRRF